MTSSIPTIHSCTYRRTASPDGPIWIDRTRGCGVSVTVCSGSAPARARQRLVAGDRGQPVLSS
ncbi:hypothetical protein [Kribbella aluminosa]|uniref:hypothetical protein n=1 Tax=Kribbella aluminosa TaxID=416017 RepID=UPI001FDAA712|nr:hypothetical protein [Kribbella aluminosa]